MRKQIDFIISGSEVTRYHTVRTLVQETVGHHSHGVALIAYLLKNDHRIVMAALCHDLAEHQTGDIPSPAKKLYGIGDQVTELENRILESAGFNFELSKEDERILKLADLAQGAIFCIREISLGNRSMETVYKRYISYAEDMVLVGKELELFLAIKEKYEEVN